MRRSRSPARRAPTRSFAPTASGETRRRSSPAAASTWSSIRSAGDRFTDSLRSLAEGGRLVVVGFTAGSIPEVKVNRLLLNNTEVIGAGWGAYVIAKPEINRQIGAEIATLIGSGHVRPLVGAGFPLSAAGAAEALNLIDGRGATGKVVLDVA